MKKRWVAVGDNHGCLVHKPAAKRFFDFLSDYKPSHKIHLGDCFDFGNLRRGADPKEEGDDMEPDLTAGYMFLEKMRPTVFIPGNHDHRLFRLTEDARGLVRQFAKEGIKQLTDYIRGINCRMVGPYHIDNFYKLGDLVFLHGFSANINAVAEHATSYGSCVMGHLHRNEMKASKRSDHARGVCVGGLGDFEKMNYASQRLATHMWGRGWAFGDYNEKTGKTTINIHLDDEGKY